MIEIISDNSTSKLTLNNDNTVQVLAELSLHVTCHDSYVITP